MEKYTIYIVDDEAVARDGMALALEKRYRVRAFSTAEAALESLPDDMPELVLLDIGLPGMSGIEALEKIKERIPDTVVIMITAYEDVQTVVSAMKLGAYDYAVKPIQMDALLVSVRNALETVTMRKEIQGLHERFLREHLPCLVGESNAIQNIMDVVSKVARSPDTPILILGETGTGKELIANAIHYRSPNFKGPMISVNCASIPRDLIESELFGYEKGAFSGANSSGKKGLIEKADNGTLFLDEVGDLSMEAQAKLLRFLEQGEYYRVGGTRKRRVRTRIVSATNKNLREMLNKGRFRHDLYYRIAVISIEVPSLNDRRDDILPIAKHFLREFSSKLEKSITGFTEEAERALYSFHYKGNVRELKNIIERSVLFSEGPVIGCEDLCLEGTMTKARAETAPRSLCFPPLSTKGIDFPAIVRNLEKHYFTEALNLTKGNECKAAQLLGLTRDTFRYRRAKLHQAA
ncbi:MAG: sigma-54-dependent Fis family transcriptional regulator [Deltaproteobacteria bacterium]|nr:sigma-54-dependent Fis family transcriptional regulator [Deltaproteobacteria bacterium]